MKYIFLLIGLLFSLASLSSQTLRVNAPRINSGIRDFGQMKDVELWISAGASYVQVDLDFSITAEETNFEDTDTLEAVYGFNLAEDVFITDSWLWFQDSIIKARIQDRWTAEETYEDIVNRIFRDPSLLTKEYGDRYTLKVFPMTKSWERKIRLSFLLPATLANGRLQATIPRGLLSTRFVHQAVIPIHFHRNLSLTNPLINGENLALSEAEFYEAEINTEWVDGSISLQYELLDQQILLQTHEHDDQNYYALAFDPDAFISARSDADRFVFVVDYSSNNTRESLTEITNHMLNSVEQYFSPGDSLGFVLDPNQDEAYWTTPSAVREDLSARFNTLDGFSIMPSILRQGVRIAQHHDVDQIFFLTNSTPIWDIEQVQRALSQINDENDESLPLHCISFQNTNFIWQSFYSQSFRNNSYFLQSLARDNNGLYAHMAQNERLSTESFMDLNFRGSFPSNVVVDIRPLGGATYEDISLNDHIKLGKYFGDEQFEVNVFDIANQRVDTSIVITPNMITNDYPIIQQWSGATLEDMTRAINGGYYYFAYDERIPEIMEMSITNRVLSTYTAFLALEPALGGKYCPYCEREIPGGIIDEDFELFSFFGNDDAQNEDISTSVKEFSERIKVAIGPNPAWDEVKITIEDGGLEIQGFKAEIFNSIGSLLGSVQSLDNSTATIDVSHLEAGLYFIAVTINGQKRTFKVVVSH